MPPQTPWSPTAYAFAYHQLNHVANFWKQGRQASFRLEALPGGQAELNLTFQLPPASEVVPPPSHEFPVIAPQRPIHPLFPQGCFPKKSDTGSNTKQCPQKKVSAKQRKSYRRSVLHKAALAMPTLPPPVNGSLRQAAQACVQRLQAASALPVSTPTTKKRSYSESDSPSALSPSNFPPLAQKIRSDLQISEESPERELLRTQPTPMKSPSLSSPRGFPPPSPLSFTPTKIQVEQVAEISLESDLESGSESDLESDSEDDVWTDDVWSERLEKRTDDPALKSRLLESLKEIYETPYSVLPTVVLRPVKDRFLEGVTTPVRFLDELQNLLKFAKM